MIVLATDEGPRDRGFCFTKLIMMVPPPNVPDTLRCMFVVVSLGLPNEGSELREVINKQLTPVSIAHDSMLLLLKYTASHVSFHSCLLFSKGIADFCFFPLNTLPNITLLSDVSFSSVYSIN